MLKLILITIGYFMLMLFLFMAWAFSIPGNPNPNPADVRNLTIIWIVMGAIALVLTVFYARYAWHISPKFLLWLSGIIVFLFLMEFLNARS
jgi:hypothetical protein